MEFRAVNDRCALQWDQLKLSLTQTEGLNHLASLGFTRIEVDLVAEARACIGTSIYKRGAHPREAPGVIDCSSYIKWLYGLRGVWLPRRSVQQRKLGEPVHPDDLRAGDVVFASGAMNWYDQDQADGVGHVGLATGTRAIIHAANKQLNVIETPFEDFIRPNLLRGIRRYLPAGEGDMITLQIPPHQSVETADDFRWIVLRTLSRLR